MNPTSFSMRICKNNMTYSHVMQIIYYTRLVHKNKIEVGMAGPKSIQTRFLEINTSTIHPYTLAFHAPNLFVKCSWLAYGRYMFCLLLYPSKSKRRDVVIVDMFISTNLVLYTFWPCHPYLSINLLNLFLFFFIALRVIHQQLYSGWGSCVWNRMWRV